jgi:hypothetical protein
MAETIPLAWIELFPDREDLSIMSRLARHANRLGICWPSQETIAKAIGVSRSTVCRRIGSILAAFPNTLQRIEHEGKNAYFLPELAHKEKNLESNSLSLTQGGRMCANNVLKEKVVDTGKASDSWLPNGEDLVWASSQRPDLAPDYIAFVTAKFTQWHQGCPGCDPRWQTMWQSWIRREKRTPAQQAAFLHWKESCSPRPERVAIPVTETAPEVEPDSPESAADSAPTAPAGPRERDRRPARIDIAGVLRRAVDRVEKLRPQPTAPTADVSPLAAESAVATTEPPPLPAVTPEETSLAIRIESLARDGTPVLSWADDLREAVIEAPALLDTAIQRRERTLQGADPARIAGMLRLFLEKIVERRPDQDIATLEILLATTIASLAENLPADLLDLAYQRYYTNVWGSGLSRMPEARDFLDQVKDEIQSRRDGLRYLKDGQRKAAGYRERMRPGWGRYRR